MIHAESLLNDTFLLVSFYWIDSAFSSPFPFYRVLAAPKREEEAKKHVSEHEKALSRTPSS